MLKEVSGVVVTLFVTKLKYVKTPFPSVDPFCTELKVAVLYNSHDTTKVDQNASCHPEPFLLLCYIDIFMSHYKCL